MTAPLPSDSPANTPDSTAETRFGFGRNWQRFRRQLTPARLERAEQSLRQFWLDREELSFLDAGSGSGTFSLVARRLGAKVHSFDYDADSVACTAALKNEFFANDPNWTVESGSVLDRDYLRSLGQFDIVYSWGVLHHTGAMWEACRNILLPLKPGGLLVVALYNNQGWKSRVWTAIKRFYCSSTLGRWLVTGLFVPGFLFAFLLADLLRFRNPFKRYEQSHDPRGMSVVTDIIDWIGGYPFEVATPDEVVAFYSRFGLALKQQTLTTGLGCSEFVFVASESFSAPDDESSG